MGSVVLIAFAFLVGLTVCGLAGSAMELACGRRLAFVEPYVSPAHVLRSLAATALAGPFMLFNDALAARRAGRISWPALASCGCTALMWTLALGIVALGVLSWTGLLLDLAVAIPA
jgi:hypothetical protein